MAKDVSEKPVSSSNSDNNNSPPTSDQQRVPPLRIVLNVSGNQKSSSASGAGSANHHQDLKREKSNDTPKTDASNVKTAGKVRIKLGTGKPANRSNSSAEPHDKPTDESQKSRLTRDQDNTSTKDDNSINYSHLRRITRRSQRTIQTISNEDEESISSMTSIDENQNSNSNNNSTTVNNNDSNGASQDCTPVTSAPTQVTTTNTSSGGSSSAADTPRRKRKKGESITETPLIDYENAFNFQNYRISVQNSFELFKNIRKHVDKKLGTLSCVHSRAPHGFKDYMLIRGAYLLDGNKLGNGTNLFMNEDGGLNPAPLGKYHALRHNRVNYTVPSRAKVPLGLPVNSPLYNLFIEQEKERYKMQIQHIKEREKLTLAAEQEIMRVYNQAAMAAVNQEEPFSACTMLKHQEIYNYLDADGVAILASEDARLDQVKPSEGVRTRRRQHEQITSPPRDSKTTSTQNAVQRSSSDPPTKEEPSGDVLGKNSAPPKEETKKSPNEIASDKKDESTPDNQDEPNSRVDGTKSESSHDNTIPDPKTEIKISAEGPPQDTHDRVKDNETDGRVGEQDKGCELPPKESANDTSDDSNATSKIKTKTEPSQAEAVAKPDKILQENDDDGKESSGHHDKPNYPTEVDIKEQAQSVSTQNEPSKKGCTVVSMDVDEEPKSTVRPVSDERVLSEDDVKAYNREVFLSQLQGIDDKWDQVRTEMFIRHRNEAESLYAIQKLEWEWKTKEIGACDIRMTPVIDETLVPKLNIYPQDY